MVKDSEYITELSEIQIRISQLSDSYKALSWKFDRAMSDIVRIKSILACFADVAVGIGDMETKNIVLITEEP